MENKGAVSFGSTIIGVALILVVVGLIYTLTAGQFQKDGAAVVGSHANATVAARIKPVGSVSVTGAEPAKAAAPVEPAAAPVATAEAAPAPAAEAPAPAVGGDALAIAQAKGCMACHQVEVKVLGPSYKDVAAKYKGDAAAFEMLVNKVKSGGSGTWGEIPMPPNAHVPEADIRAVVEWLLSL